jgi:hypothetical protein
MMQEAIKNFVKKSSKGIVEKKSTRGHCCLNKKKCRMAIRELFSTNEFMLRVLFLPFNNPAML